MVLPVYKVISLVIRVLSRPLINYTKRVHLKNNNLSLFFISLGNRYNRMETWINKKFMKIQTQFAYKPLNDQLAIEKGIQFFYQVLFYFLVLGLPIYQLYRAGHDAKQKSNQTKNKIVNLQSQTSLILQQLKGIQKDIEQLKKKNENNEKQIIDHRIESLDLCGKDIKINFEFKSKSHIYHLCYI